MYLLSMSKTNSRRKQIKINIRITYITNGTNGNVHILIFTWYLCIQWFSKDFFITVHGHLFLAKHYSYCPLKLFFPKFYVFTRYWHVPCFQTTLIIYHWHQSNWRTTTHIHLSKIIRSYTHNNHQQEDINKLY